MLNFSRRRQKGWGLPEVLLNLLVSGVLLWTANIVSAQTVTSSKLALAGVVNDSNYSGSSLPELALDALTKSLLQSTLYEVIPGGQVKKALVDAHLWLPLGREGFRTLAKMVDADWIMIARLSSCTIIKGTAMVQLQTEIHSPFSGELLSKALSLGTSSPSAGSTTQSSQIIGEALTAAARNAVAQLTALAQLQGVVALTWDGDGFTVNLGSRNGIKAGAEVLVSDRLGQNRLANVCTVRLADSTLHFVADGPPFSLVSGQPVRVIFNPLSSP